MPSALGGAEIARNQPELYEAEFDSIQRKRSTEGCSGTRQTPSSCSIAFKARRAIRPDFEHDVCRALMKSTGLGALAGRWRRNDPPAQFLRADVPPFGNC
jgi:hypothetical protein